MKTLTLILAASLALAASSPVAAHQHFPPGAAIGLGVLGLALGAAAAAGQQYEQQAPPVCTAEDGSRYYARWVGEWTCETDD